VYGSPAVAKSLKTVVGFNPGKNSIATPSRHNFIHLTALAMQAMIGIQLHA
jgi:hypothetical protein